MTSLGSAVRRFTPLGALLAADGCSRVGNAVTVVAVPLLALAIDGSPWAVAAAGAAATLPYIVGGALGGVVVDRVGFRRASILADAASGVTILLIPLLAAVGALPIWALLALVFCSNLFDAPGNAARQSQIPELSEAIGVALSRVTSAQAAVSRTATLVGASLAGLLVAFAGPAVTMYVTAATFAAAILLTVVFVPRLALPVEEGASVDSASGAGAGFRFVLRTPLVRAVVIMVVLTNAIDIAGLTVLKPLYATTLGDDGAALGLMVACSAGGALIGATLYGIIGDRVPRHGLYIVLFLVAGVLPYVTLSLGPPFPVVAAVLAVAGLASGPINPLIDSALFHLIPARIRARVLGAITAAVTAAMPLGSLVAGLGVDALGLAPTLLVAAGLYLAVILATGFGRRWREF